MSILLLITIGSGVSAFVLTLLFYIERVRGRRLGEGVRSWLDAMTDTATVRWHTMLLYTGQGSGRVGVHYLLHRCLGIAGSGTQALHGRIEGLKRRNRRVARSVQAARVESHLTAIAAHKHDTALSEEEKSELKERSLAG